MNTEQRRIIIRALYALAVLCAVPVLVVVIGAALESNIAPSDMTALMWSVLIGAAAIVAALYLRAGSKSE